MYMACDMRKAWRSQLRVIVFSNKLFNRVSILRKAAGRVQQKSAIYFFAAFCAGAEIHPINRSPQMRLRNQTKSEVTEIRLV